MPGTITHNYILFKALQDYTPADNSPISLVKKSNDQMYEYGCQNQHERYVSDDACLLASCAYLGCCGPDLWYIEHGTPVAAFLADLQHYNRTGLYMIWCLQKVKLVHRAGVMTARFGQADLRLFAYCLGHICHIATDICGHPYVNSIVGAYPDNPRVYNAGPGWLPRVATVPPLSVKNIWKFHNVLEHHQDSYIWHKRFIKDEKFAEDWANVNMAMGAAHFYRDQVPAERFLVTNCTTYYNLPQQFPPSVEEDRYSFFTGDKFLLNAQSYLLLTLPGPDMVNTRPLLIQGGQDGPDGLFDQYVTDAISQTKVFWGEVDDYLNGDQERYDDSLVDDKPFFPQLRKHWNLDTGLYPEAREDVPAHSWLSGPDQNEDLETRLCVAGRLSLRSVFSDPKNDLDGR
jgi:hypothetical protein